MPHKRDERHPDCAKLVGAFDESQLFLLFGRSQVRRAERRMVMATATKRVRTAKQVAGGALDESESAAMEFLVFEDNGGGYHWTIVAAGGESLAQSGSFASHD